MADPQNTTQTAKTGESGFGQTDENRLAYKKKPRFCRFKTRKGPHPSQGAHPSQGPHPTLGSRPKFGPRNRRESNRAFQYHQKLAESLGRDKERDFQKIDQLHRHNFWASLRWAVRGLYYAFRTQRNFRIELALAVCTLALGLFFGIARAEWSIILLSVCLVLASELANTALEYMVDLYEKKFDYLAMMAKDIAAACVLLSSIHALVQGVLVFGPYVADIVKKAFLPL